MPDNKLRVNPSSQGAKFTYAIRDPFMSAIDISFSGSILFVRFPKRKMTGLDLTYFTSYMETLWKEQQNFVWMIDVMDSPLQDPVLQYKAAVWAKENKTFFRKLCWGTAYLINDGITRRIIKLFLNTLGARKIIGPVEFFDDRETAIKWTENLVELKKRNTHETL
jgi:hypothetical protein